jgi:transmembrane sensor
MNTDKSRTQINEQILEEACGWFIEFNEGEPDAREREHFNQWLYRSSEHVGAYFEIAAAWEESSNLRSPKRVEPESLVTDTLAESNVIPLLAMSPHHAHPKYGGKRLSWLFLAVAASALIAIGMGFMTKGSSYSTGIGEQRSILLDDGSTVELNARSRLRVRFSHAERVVVLIDGQALFLVRKDVARPFIVLSGEARVHAVGTQFDVYRKTTGTTVTVVEGQVTVTEVRTSASPSGSAQMDGRGDTEAPVFLSAGEQLTMAPQTVPHPVRANLAAAVAWTQRKLIFDETPLPEVIAEFNRYNARQMIVEDASLAEYHIRGTFDAGDPDRLVQFLRDRFGADVRERGNEIRISRK